MAMTRSSQPSEGIDVKKNFLAGLVGLGLILNGPLALAAGDGPKAPNHSFSFDGPFGSFDQAQLQRGFQVYQEICSGCHGLKYVAFRTLGDKGGPEFDPEAVKAIAEQYEFEDDEGEFIPGKPFQKFPQVLDAGAPDLSLMTKARPHGPDYIYALLNGYEDAPECAPDDIDGNYNKYFGSGGFPDECKYKDDPKHEDGEHKVPGSWIAMGQPLWGEDVEYTDGTEASIEQAAEDIVAFLTWTAEPHMVARKQAGIWSLGYLAIFAVLLWFTNKKIWKKIKHPE